MKNINIYKIVKIFLEHLYITQKVFNEYYTHRALIIRIKSTQQVSCKRGLISTVHRSIQINFYSPTTFYGSLSFLTPQLKSPAVAL